METNWPAVKAKRSVSATANSRCLVRPESSTERSRCAVSSWRCVATGVVVIVMVWMRQPPHGCKSRFHHNGQRFSAARGGELRINFKDLYREEGRTRRF